MRVYESKVPDKVREYERSQLKQYMTQILASEEEQSAIVKQIDQRVADEQILRRTDAQ